MPLNRPGSRRTKEVQNNIHGGKVCTQYMVTECGIDNKKLFCNFYFNEKEDYFETFTSYYGLLAGTFSGVVKKN